MPIKNLTKNRAAAHSIPSKWRAKKLAGKHAFQWPIKLSERQIAACGNCFGLCFVAFVTIVILPRPSISVPTRPNRSGTITLNHVQKVACLWRVFSNFLSDILLCIQIWRLQRVRRNATQVQCTERHQKQACWTISSPRELYRRDNSEEGHTPHSQMVCVDVWLLINELLDNIFLPNCT